MPLCPMSCRRAEFESTISVFDPRTAWNVAVLRVPEGTSACGPFASVGLEEPMKSLPNDAFLCTKSPFNTRTLATIIGFAIAIFVAVYVITVDPNDAVTTIGFPP
jgi:hypothetical protein